MARRRVTRNEYYCLCNRESMRSGIMICQECTSSIDVRSRCYGRRGRCSHCTTVIEATAIINLSKEIAIYVPRRWLWLQADPKRGCHLYTKKPSTVYMPYGHVSKLNHSGERAETCNRCLWTRDKYCAESVKSPQCRGSNSSNGRFMKCELACIMFA